MPVIIVFRNVVLRSFQSPGAGGDAGAASDRTMSNSYVNEVKSH